MMINNRSRLASALLLVISMIVLMVTIATSFMTTMSRQRGTAVMLSARTRCEIGMEHIQSLLIKKAIEEYLDPSVTYSLTKGKPSESSQWYRDSLPKGDPDADPWTEDGAPLGTGYNDTDNMVNIAAGLDVTDMMQRGTGDWRSEYYGVWTQYSGTRSGWHNVTFYDDFMQPKYIDDTWAESKKADIRRSSRYVLRYSFKTIDCGGQLTPNNNYPDAPIIYDGSNELEFNRYQNYLHHFGRSIKSMTGISNYGSDARQYRSDDEDPANNNYAVTRDPFDQEELSLFPDGLGWRRFDLENDLRLRRQSVFRMDPLNWVERTNKLDQKSLHVIGGNRLTTWYQIGRHHGGTGMNGAYYAPHFQFTPYGEGMLAAPLKSTNPDPCTVPWKVNLFTCAPQTLTCVYGGLSSHIKHGSGPSYDTDPKPGSETSWWSKAQYANADLFGPNYPDPFPLGYEDGKDVHLVGEVNDGSVIPKMKKTKSRTFGGILNTGDKNIILPAQGGSYKYPAVANSYWVDIHYAMEMTRKRMEQAWRQKKVYYAKAGHCKSEADYWFVGVNPITGAKIVGDNSDSYIDMYESDPAVMLNQILMETYRILGEGYIKPHSAGVPATSWNKYNHALPGLLAGGESFVGVNVHYHGDFPMRRSQLSPHANTRGMEFVLNDVMISLYGKANPYYDPASDPLSQIAVDFNGDGYAESTVTGWYNSSTAARTWSWWWNGLGMEAQTTYPWMKKGAWIRFHEDGSVQRKRGNQWIDITDATEKAEFFAVNDIFLTGTVWNANNGPIRPFSHTGRLIIGKAKMLQYFLRVEIFNIPQRKVMAATNRTFLYHIDPNGDGSFEDSHVASQQEFDLKSSDL